MAKQSDRNKDRLGQVFSVLSDGNGEQPPAREAERGNPWRVAALLLLIVALALPMATGIRASNRELEREEKVDEARADAAEARGLLEKRRIGSALTVLDRAASRLADLPDFRRATQEIKVEYERVAGELDRTKESLSQLRRAAASRRKAVESLLVGDAENAADALAAASATDPEAGELATLARRLVRWSLAEDSGDRVRPASLGNLAREWPLPALRRTAERARSLEATDKKLGDAITAARAALTGGDHASAGRYLNEAFRLAGVEGVDGFLAELQVWKRLDRAQQLEEQGRIPDAATLFASLALDGVSEAEPKARVLGEEVRRRQLRGALEQLARGAEHEGAHLEAAVLSSWLASAADGERRRPEESPHYRKWLAQRAAALYADGKAEAALAVTREAAGLGSSAAQGFARKIESEIAGKAREEAQERARAALGAGVPELARSILRGAKLEVPADLEAQIQLRQADRQLREIRARLVAGELDDALARLPENPTVRMVELVRAALSLPATDRAGFARLMTRAIAEAGPREDLRAALALALEEAGQVEKAKPHWEALRDAALERAPLPKPEVKPIELPDEKPEDKPDREPKTGKDG